jgi:hypothetical protein
MVMVLAGMTVRVGRKVGSVVPAGMRVISSTTVANDVPMLKPEEGHRSKPSDTQYECEGVGVHDAAIRC